MKVLTGVAIKALFDYDELSGHLRHKNPIGCAGKGRVAGYNRQWGRLITVDGTKYLARRLVWLWHNGTLPDGQIRALNRDVYDTRIENLTLKGGMIPRVKMHNGYPRFRGVNYVLSRKQWKACVRKKGQYINLGYFSTYDLAVLARLIWEEEDTPNERKVKYYDND